MAIYNPENILQHLDLSSVKFFTFKKDDVKNKKTKVPNRLLEVKGTRKCHKVLVDPESVKIIMKDTSNQIGKACQFSIRKKIKKENNDAEKDKDKSNEDKSKDENGGDEKVEELDVELDINQNNDEDSDEEKESNNPEIKEGNKDAEGLESQQLKVGN